MEDILKFWVTIGFIFLVNVGYAQPSANTVYGPVKPGEMLWTIAARLPFDKSVNRHQIVLALLQANPQAFKNPCNLNSLKAEVILQIPSLSTVNVIDRTYAIQEIAKQAAQWHNRKIQPVTCSPQDAPAQAASSTEITSPKQETVEKAENTNPDSLAQTNPVTPKTVVDSLPFSIGHDIHTLWDDTHLTSLIILLIGGIVIGIMIGIAIGWKLWATQLNVDKKPDDKLIEAKSVSSIVSNADNGEHITITVAKKRFEQWQFIQKYSENYRFYPLTEALLIGLTTFIAILLTSYFIFYHALEAQKEEIREGLIRTAQAMTTTIDTELHQTFTHKEQEDSEVYQNAIKPFARILELNTQIKFVYTVILKNDKIYFIFDPTPDGDADGDGVEDSVDIMQEYDDPSGLYGEALRNQHIVATQEPFTDQWGTYFGAYVPFSDKNGNLVGVLGMDITADNYYKRLMPIKRATVRAIVAGFFIAFIIGSLVWFTRNFSTVINRNRSLLLKELLDSQITLRSLDTTA